MCRQNPRKFRGVPVVEEMVKKLDFNIQVVWLPPYHPMLNHIEEAWGITKGHVADVNDGRDFKAVKSYIYDGFAKVTPEVWKRLVRRTYNNEDELIEKHKVFISRKLPESERVIIERF